MWLPLSWKHVRMSQYLHYHYHYHHRHHHHHHRHHHYYSHGLIELLIPRSIKQICLSLKIMRDNYVFFPLLGVYTAVHNLQVQWVVVKGISDYADGTKDSTSNWRPYASVMAASLVAHVLRQPSIFKDWPRHIALSNEDCKIPNSRI